jgi:hypothetical protein
LLTTLLTSLWVTYLSTNPFTAPTAFEINQGAAFDAIVVKIGLAKNIFIIIIQMFGLTLSKEKRKPTLTNDKGQSKPISVVSTYK